ncbi:hypothetical protein SCLCIDRAFT_407695 [Scleroderma citrinum Foug A]|uniref:Uncharacterized protein n=1 Tax=Scleroderma citrinum Foug A TaxID=1036808 RepID=A0A0C2ZMN3_9AGAM|nr:hypothetical protein SCLCIDRAFT_407695 [Scleroderma citrinum Foug A]
MAIFASVMFTSVPALRTPVRALDGSMWLPKPSVTSALHFVPPAPSLSIHPPGQSTHPPHSSTHPFDSQGHLGRLHTNSCF